MYLASSKVPWLLEVSATCFSWSVSHLETTELAHGLTRARETPLVPGFHRTLQQLLKKE